MRVGWMFVLFVRCCHPQNLQAKAEDDDEESSESESESSESDEESDEDDDDFVHLDLGSCPKDCSESVYKEVQYDDNDGVYMYYMSGYVSVCVDVVWAVSEETTEGQEYEW